MRRCGVRRHLAVALCSLLPACGIFDFEAQPSRDHSVAIALSPTTAAWVIAEVCRKHLPDADPLTMHAHAPLYRVGPDHFLIRYTAHDGDGFRVIQNGRISGPAGDGSVRGCTFHASPQASGNSSWIRDAGFGMRVARYGMQDAECGIRDSGSSI